VAGPKQAQNFGRDLASRLQRRWRWLSWLAACRGGARPAAGSWMVFLHRDGRRAAGQGTHPPGAGSRGPAAKEHRPHPAWQRLAGPAGAEFFGRLPRQQVLDEQQRASGRRPAMLAPDTAAPARW